MAKTWCIPKKEIQLFRADLKARNLNIEDLMNMKSDERTKLFKKYAGDSARDMNILFEQKLILKNRVQGIKNWIAKIGEIGRYDPQKKAELKRLQDEFKQKQQQRLFSPKENESFLADLVETKLGMKITREEATNIFKFTEKVKQLKQKYNPETQKWTSEKDRHKYGAAKVMLEKYMEVVKGYMTIKDMVISRSSQFAQEFKERPSKAMWNLFVDSIKTISDASISLMASIDISFLGRQGLKVLMTHPTVWAGMAKNAFLDFAKTIGGQESMDALMADYYSRVNYMNGSYEIAKLVPKTEEQYPTSFPERIPIIGRAFKASEAAFVGSAVRSRMDLFDLIQGFAKKNQVDVDVQTPEGKYEVQSIGKLINSMTARGSLGKYGEGVVKVLLWAPRIIKANWDVLTAHVGQDISSFAGRQAAKNLVKIVAFTSLILAIAKAYDDDSVELDPRSSNFGKLKFGETTFDITGGAASLITLASRLLTGEVKSSRTGLITSLNTGEYGAKTKYFIILDFLRNKTAPFTSMVIDFMAGETFGGEKPTLLGALYKHGTPISIQNIIELKDSNSADAVLGVISDVFGISSNTYIEKLSEAQKEYKRIISLPIEQQKIAFEELERNNPDLADKVKEVDKQTQLGFDETDIAISNLGIKDGGRATAIWQIMSGMDTKEEQTAYIKSMKNKGIINDDNEKSIKAQFENLKKWGFAVQEEYIENRSRLDLIKDYASAFSTDFWNAWKAFSTKEKLEVVKGNLVELQRFYGIDYDVEGGSEEYKIALMEKQGIPMSESGNWYLEHITPRAVGGGNEDDNLMLSNTEDHTAWTAVEIEAYNAIIEEKATRQELEPIFKQLKMDRTITPEEAINKINQL